MLALQIGRSMEGPIDFVVMDTVPGHMRTQKDATPQSTISRFACRIIVERSPPYTARIYAAGFDSGRNIFLGVCRIDSLEILMEGLEFLSSYCISRKIKMYDWIINVVLHSQM